MVGREPSLPFPFHCWPVINLRVAIPVSLLVVKDRSCSLFFPVSLLAESYCSG